MIYWLQTVAYLKVVDECAYISLELFRYLAKQWIYCINNSVFLFLVYTFIGGKKKNAPILIFERDFG